MTLSYRHGRRVHPDPAARAHRAHRGHRVHRARRGRRGHRTISLATAMLALAACDTGTEPVLVGSLALAPGDSVMTLGSWTQLSVTVLSTTGSVLPGHPVSWSSTAPAVASVSGGGRVDALAPGTATIRASSGDISASRAFLIEAGPCTSSTAGSIALAERRTGRVDRTDCTLNWGRAEGWSLQLTAPTAVRIRMTSPDFYPAPVVTDRALETLLWPNVWGETVEIFGQLPAGEYIVWAASDSEEAVGSYEISIDEVQPCTAGSAGSALAIPGSLSGTLGASDCVFMHGVAADGVALSVDTTTGLRISLASTAFEPLVLLTDLELNVVAWNDGASAYGEAVIEQRQPPGEYILWATGYDGAASGPYELSVSEVEISLCPVVGDLAAGTDATGSLADTDCLQGRGYQDPWRLTLAAEIALRIDLTSDAFDTFLIIEDEHGVVLLDDDDGGEGFDSRIELTLAPGEYRVVATSFSYGATGSYQLTARALSSSGSLAADGGGPGAAVPPWAKRRPYE